MPKSFGPRDRASELEDLIQLQQQLASRYRSLLERYPGPIPDAHPAVQIEGKVVFVAGAKTGRKPLLPKDRRKLKKSQAHRRDLLAIWQPFAAPWWPKSSRRMSPAQKGALKWRAEFDDLANRTGEHYRIYKDSDRIKDLPLLHIGRTIGGEDLLRAIDRQLEIMRADRVGASSSGRISKRTKRENEDVRNIRVLVQQIAAELRSQGPVKDIHLKIVQRLHNYSRPPGAKWAHLPWDTAIRDRKYKRSVRAWISKAIHERD